jgi:hypothetical protein
MSLDFFKIIEDSFILHLDDEQVVAVLVSVVLLAAFKDVFKGL